MRKIKTFVFVVFLMQVVCLQSCSKNDSEPATPPVPNNPAQPGNTWKETEVFPGIGRDNAFSFAIGDKLYIGMGSGFINNAQQDIKDFYEYNATTNKWLKKADVPSDGPLDAVSFSINGKGYVGLGVKYECPFPGAPCNPVLSKDIFEYDPALNTWKKVASFNGTVYSTIRMATSFIANNKAFIVSGNEIWEFDPANYSFSLKAPCPEFFNGASSFAINNKGYVVNGGWVNGLGPNYTKTFYEYDPVTDKWTKKLDFPGEGRHDAIGFALKGKGYLVGGEGMKQVSPTQSVGFAFKDFWQYSPDTDKWIKVKDYPGKGEYRMIASAMSDKAFVGTGWAWLPNDLPKDFWQYNP